MKNGNISKNILYTVLDKNERKVERNCRKTCAYLCWTVACLFGGEKWRFKWLLPTALFIVIIILISITFFLNFHFCICFLVYGTKFLFLYMLSSCSLLGDGCCAVAFAMFKFCFCFQSVCILNCIRNCRTCVHNAATLNFIWWGGEWCCCAILKKKKLRCIGFIALELCVKWKLNMIYIYSWYIVENLGQQLQFRFDHFVSDVSVHWLLNVAWLSRQLCDRQNLSFLLNPPPPPFPLIPSPKRLSTEKVEGVTKSRFEN